MDYYITSIQEGITALVSIADLNTALTNSDAYKNKAADYTADSYARNLITAVSAADAVLTSSAESNTEVTKDQVATAVQGITAAITGLVKSIRQNPLIPGIRQKTALISTVLIWMRFGWHWREAICLWVKPLLWPMTLILGRLK